MKERKASNWLKVTLLVFCLVLLLLVVFRLVQENASDEELRAFQERYRALGYPVTMEELKEAHEVPEGEENVAPLLLAAIDRLDDSDVDYEFVPIFGNYQMDLALGVQLPDDVASESHYLLSINDETLNNIRQLIRKPYCRFPVEWDNIMGAHIDRYAGMRNLARFFALRALLYGEAGDLDSAIDAIEDIYLVGGIEQKQPKYISYLVGTAIIGFGPAYMQTLLESAEFRDDELLRLVDIVQAAKEQDDPLYSMLSEYLLMENYYENLREMASSEWPTSKMFLVMDSVHSVSGLAASDARATRRNVDAHLEIFTLPLREAVHEIEAIQPPFFFSQFPMGEFREIGAIGGGGLHGVFARQRTLYDAVLTALQVERFRLKGGVLPDSLEALVPEYLDEVPQDPYGEGELRFRVVGESYVVYSIGPNRIDDGGYDFKADKAIPLFYRIAFVVRREKEKLPIEN